MPLGRSIHMNGLMKKYRESLANTPGPVDKESIPKVRIDYKGLLKFAKEKGVTPADLSFEETLPFMTELVEGELDKVAAIAAG